MELLTMHFLFNLSLLLVLFFLFLFVSQKSGSFLLSNRTAKIYFIFSVIICFTFSYRISEEFIVDLRLMPFIVGGLYYRISHILVIVLIGLRAIYGIDSGFYSLLILYIVLSVLIWYISPWFLKLTYKYRILFSMGLTFVVSICILVYLLIISHAAHTLDFVIALIVVPTLGVAMLTFILESVDRNMYLQQQLVRSEKLQAIEQMGAAMSHEIRNPLTTAIGFVELLHKDLLLTEKRTEYLSILKEELDSAEKIIQDYLTFSKPLIESRQEINIQQELLHIINLLQPLANYHSVKITTRFLSNDSITGDQSQFHQAFINIMRNSIESMVDGGLLKIETTNTHSNVIITIQDTGIGLSKEEIKSLGEPYYSYQQEKGLGYNLMVSYSILQALNGTLQIESELCYGTNYIFSFKIPSLITD